jgi:uncharacterized damage-inducible protein DinB
MDQADLDIDRGAFFGSIQSTLSHLLWGDLLWMSRLDAASPAPQVSPQDSAQAFKTKADWLAERRLCDRRMRTWAEGIQAADLNGDLTWTYSYDTQQATKPMGFVITHFFNHQTHHRGQVHAMLTAAEQSAPVSDLSYLPEDA